jgi:hypothetical protein
MRSMQDGQEGLGVKSTITGQKGALATLGV